MSLTGRIEIISFHAILQLLSQEKKTGIFNLNWLVVLKINTIQLLMDALKHIDEHDVSGRKIDCAIS